MTACPVTPGAVITRRSARAHRLAYAALVASLGLAACGGQQPQVRASTPGGDAAPLASRAAPGQPGVAPDRPAPPVDAPRPVGPDPALVHARWRKQLTNAARRDRAMDMTMRHYMLITREVFRRLQRARPRSAAGPMRYNPVPAWRFQGQAQADFRRLSERSGLLDLHLADLAKSLGVPGVRRDETGRGGRIALYRSIFSCIRVDTGRRAAHGGEWTKRGGEGAALTELDRARLYQQELQLMRQSVRCSTLIASRRAR